MKVSTAIIRNIKSGWFMILRFFCCEREITFTRARRTIRMSMMGIEIPE
jgi:hypothetical protein